jgi:osmotically-inducible protein OsmY
MKFRLPIIIVASWIVLGSQWIAWGQANRTIGSGTTGTTQSAQGSSAFGTSTTLSNNNSGGTTTDTSGTDFSSSSTADSVMQNMQSLGFVGANSSNNTNSILGGVGSSSSTGTTQTTGANNTANNLNLNTNTTTNQPTTNTNSRLSNRELPAKLNISFSHPKPTTNNVAYNVSQAIKSRALTSKQLPNSSVKVEVLNGTAILRGSVASTHDRALAETLVRMEPGVWKVQNELELVDTVMETASTR